MTHRIIVTKYLATVGNMTCNVEGRGITQEAAYQAAVGELRLRFGRFLTTGSFKLRPLMSRVVFG